MTRSEIIEELKIIVIGLVSFIRSYIVPALVFVYVTIITIIESVKDQTKAEYNWKSFGQFWKDYKVKAGSQMSDIGMTNKDVR